MNTPGPARWQVTPDREGLASLQRQAADWLQRSGVETRRAQHILLALDELAANVVEHGRAAHWLQLDLASLEDAVELELRDDAAAFDPTRVAEAAGGEPGIGGHGLRLVRRLASAFEYRRVHGHNHVRLRFARNGD